MALTGTFAMTRNGARFVASRILLDQQATSTPGQWWDTLQLHPFTVVISGQYTLTPDTGGFTVLVSNGVGGFDPSGNAIITKPDDADIFYPTLGPELITTPYSVLSDGPYRWVKVVVTGLVSGSVSAAWSAAVNVGEKG